MPAVDGSSVHNRLVTEAAAATIADLERWATEVRVVKSPRDRLMPGFVRLLDIRRDQIAFSDWQGWRPLDSTLQASFALSVLDNWTLARVAQATGTPRSGPPGAVSDHQSGPASLDAQEAARALVAAPGAPSLWPATAA